MSELGSHDSVQHLSKQVASSAKQSFTSLTHTLAVVVVVAVAAAAAAAAVVVVVVVPGGLV